MTEDVNKPETVESGAAEQALSNKEFNFRRLEQARDQEREARIRAEMQAQALQKEVESIKQMLQPKEKDPLDDLEDYADSAQLKSKIEAKLAKERATYERKAQEIARETYQQAKQEDERKNFLQRLQSEFRDFDDVMTPENLQNLEKTNPVFLETVLRIDDDYERRKLAYKYLKTMKKTEPEVVPTIKDRVEENQKNPFMIPSSHGTSNAAVDFDVKSPQARQLAYEKLKQAQRNPVGMGRAV